MDQIRRVLAVVAIVVYGPGLLFWFLVHPLARFWRKLGPAITYLIVITALALIGLRVFQVSGTLIGRDLGTNWSLIVLGAVLFGPCGWIGLASLVAISRLREAPIPVAQKHRFGRGGGCRLVPGSSAHLTYCSTGSHPSVLAPWRTVAVTVAWYGRIAEEGMEHQTLSKRLWMMAEEITQELETFEIAEATVERLSSEVGRLKKQIAYLEGQLAYLEGQLNNRGRPRTPLSGAPLWSPNALKRPHWPLARR